VKRTALIKLLVKSGCVLIRHGKRHDIYMNKKNGRKAPIPRHSEIKNTLCGLIKKQLSIE
jgi:mRNA interferase HicA